MSQSEARAWWADVEHLRESLDRRRSAAPAASPAAEAHSFSALSPAPRRRTVVVTGRGAPSAPVTPRPLVDIDSRRPARVPTRALHRPDRVVMWAVLLGFALMLVAVSSANAATSLGDRVLKVPAEGRDVRLLQLDLRKRGLLRAQATARYGALTKAAVKRYQRSRCLEDDGIAGPSTIASIRANEPRCPKQTEDVTLPSGGSVLRSRVVTWYGPGFYGRRTACGQRLTKKLVGVAHRTLPCGTRVRFISDGKTVVAPVVDRGPHTRGVHYDLTWSAARQLGVLAAGRASVRASK